MYFPIAEATVAVWYLIAIGFAVGLCGGFWGVGGGWIVAPALFAAGVPMNIIVGTSLAQIVGQSVVSTFWHSRFGNVSYRVAAMMIPGTIVGVEIGARVMEYLKSFGQAHTDQVISILYIILLGGLAAYTLLEGLYSQRALRRERPQQEHAEAEPSSQSNRIRDRVSFDLAQRLQHLRLPPMVSCPLLRIKCISFWVVFGAAMLAGILAGLLGGGGGFLRVPMLVYLIGCPTHVAVGTGLFAIIVSGSFGSFTHALKGNVDLLMALLMLSGGLFGAQLGSFSVRYVQGTQLRALFGGALLGATASIIAKGFFGMRQLASILINSMAGLMVMVILGLLVRGILRTRHNSLGVSPSTR